MIATLRAEPLSILDFSRRIERGSARRVQDWCLHLRPSDSLEVVACINTVSLGVIRKSFHQLQTSQPTIKLEVEVTN